MSSGGELTGQEKDLMYGKTPGEFSPYNNFQKAYKYHFLEPIQFYGAGREKLPPKDLQEVRIGFLGPTGRFCSCSAWKTNVKRG